MNKNNLQGGIIVKKTAKNLTILLFSLSMIFAMCIPAFAVGNISKLKATATYNSVTLSWAKVSKADGYEVYTLSGKNWKLLTSTQSTSYVHKNLKINTTYKYRIRAYDKKLFSKEYGKYSSTVSAKTALTKVTGVKASATPTTVKLTWSKVSGARGYKVYAYSNKKWVYKGKTTKNTLTLSKLTPNSTYKYAVSAYRTVSKKTYEGAKSSTVTAKTTIAKVTSLKATVTPKSVKLTWSKVSGATGYNLYLYSNKKWVYKGKTTKNSITPAGVTPGSTYKYAVKAYVTVGKKTYTGAISSSVTAKTTIPTVSGLKVASSSPTAVKLSWNKASNVTGYKLYLYTGGKWVYQQKTTANSVTPTGATPGSTYKYAVKAYVTVGGKDYEGAISSSVTASTELPTVTGLKVDSATATSINLSWNKASGIKGYKLYVKNNDQWVYKQTTTANSVSPSGVQLGTTYQFAVKTYVVVGNKEYEGPMSAAISAKCVLSAPTSLKYVKSTANTADISWKAADAATGYEIFIKSGSDYVKKDTVSATSCTLTGLAAGTEYSIYVRAYSDLGPTYSTNVYLDFKTVPAKVSGLTVDAQATYATLSWDKMPGAEGYVVYKVNLATNELTELTKTVDTTYKVTGLTPETEYAYTVKAYSKTNGITLNGETADTLKFSTYFAQMESFEASDVTLNYCRINWTPISGASYELEKMNPKTGKWEAFRSGYYSTTTSDSFSYNVFPVKVSSSGNKYATVVSFDKQLNSSNYTVQYKTPNSGWTDAKTTSDTSAKFYLAPNTQYSVRVISHNRNYRIRAIKDVDGVKKQTGWLYLNGLACNVSAETSYTTPAVTYNSKSNESKTVNTLRLVQAINNTRHDRSNFTMQNIYSMDAALDSLDANGLDLNMILKLFPDAAKELNASLCESNDVTYTCADGRAVFTKGGQQKTTFVTTVMTPSADQDAYFYNHNDIDNFAKKIKSISVANNADGSCTMSLTLVKETSKNGAAMPIHEGFTENISSITDMMAGSMGEGTSVGSSNTSMGETTISATITKDNMLNKLEIKSPFTLEINNMKMSVEGVDLTMSMKTHGTITNKYVFTR